MWSWSPRETAAWRRDRRGQAEPIAAIVAVLAIGVGLALYAGVAAEQRPERSGSDAEATMERLTAEAMDDGVLDAQAALEPDRYARPGEAVNVTIQVGDGPRTAGPAPPADADAERRPITVRTDSGEQLPGVLILEVWET